MNEKENHFTNELMLMSNKLKQKHEIHWEIVFEIQLILEIPKDDEFVKVDLNEL